MVNRGECHFTEKAQCCDSSVFFLFFQVLNYFLSKGYSNSRSCAVELTNAGKSECDQCMLDAGADTTDSGERRGVLCFSHIK